ncbi:hypothetical protein [Actinomadura flavalba]|uniref:hypothetical protein n=1 Tax=Actinomadura flavalba TaxID=1120938 RepID=UPI000377B96F|nr:hypothetical protein [Actinomadura flavalba]
MDVHVCGHVAEAATGRLCRHLLGPGDESEFVRVLRGRALEYDLCCTACDTADQAPEFLVVCAGCAVRVDEENGTHVGWRGEPGIAERPEPAPGPLVRTPLPEALRGALDLAPLPDGENPAWLVLTRDGAIVRWDAGTGVVAEIAADPLPPEPGFKPFIDKELTPRLHVAPRGDAAAIVHDYGRYGAVLALATGEVTLRLDGGDYWENTVPFSLAFTEHGGRTVVAHRTRWNALAVSDALTGAQVVPGGDGMLFHGALHASPGGRHIVSDAWAWSPVGAVRVWDLRRWLDGNTDEPEDGPSARSLCHRAYLWDHPVCWIGDDLVAVAGIGGDELALLDGARVFDAGTGAEILAFPGPRGAFFSDGRRLYAAAPGGLEIWDAWTGERTATVPGFVPERLHAAAGELAGRDGDVLVRLPLR